MINYQYNGHTNGALIYDRCTIHKFIVYHQPTAGIHSLSSLVNTFAVESAHCTFCICCWHMHTHRTRQINAKMFPVVAKRYRATSQRTTVNHIATTVSVCSVSERGEVSGWASNRQTNDATHNWQLNCLSICLAAWMRSLVSLSLSSPPPRCSFLCRCECVVCIQLV